MRTFPLLLLLLVFTAVLTREGQADELAIHEVTVGNPVPVPDNSGDTWAPAWTKDGSIYTPSNDTNGFKGKGGSNIAFNRIFGEVPVKANGESELTGDTVNYMAPDYGRSSEQGPDGRTWKSSGCLAVDGALYWTIARHAYGGQQSAQNSSLIKSIDGGKTWTRPEKENMDHPMFPGSGFATPYFVNYGQEGHEAVVDHSDQYVYALSNNGFWDNGDDMVLGRVARSKIGNLDAKDWQFFTSGDGMTDSSWSSKASDAMPVLAMPNHLGMTGATFLPAQKCYLMVGWYYPAGGGKKTPDACKTTTWDFYVAQHPWGPWKSVGSHTWMPQAFYCPEICPKFTSADGSKIWAFTAGNWNDGSVYKLVLVPMTLK